VISCQIHTRFFNNFAKLLTATFESTFIPAIEAAHDPAYLMSIFTAIFATIMSTLTTTNIVPYDSASFISIFAAFISTVAAANISAHYTTGFKTDKPTKSTADITTNSEALSSSYTCTHTSAVEQTQLASKSATIFPTINPADFNSF
jgi:hypothetical protein